MPMLQLCCNYAIRNWVLVKILPHEITYYWVLTPTVSFIHCFKIYLSFFNKNWLNIWWKGNIGLRILSSKAVLFPVVRHLKGVRGIGCSDICGYMEFLNEKK